MNDSPPPRIHLVERALEAMAARNLGLTLAEPSLLTPPPPPPPSATPPTPADGAEPPAFPGAVVAIPDAPVVSIEDLRSVGLSVALDGLGSSRVREEFALVQQQLTRVMDAIPRPTERPILPRAIMVTSARRGEGRSFVAMNLAASLAADGGQSVVLIDADRGATSLSSMLRLPGATPAVTTQRPQDALMPTAVPRLSILPREDDTTAPAGRSGGGDLVATLRALAAARPNHIQVVDAPAALSSSHAHALAAIVGQVIMVVQAEATPRDAVEAALDVVEECPSLQLLLNRTHLHSRDSIAAQSRHGAAVNG